MNRQRIQRWSLAGGVAAVATALAAATLADNHESEPVFDPSNPAVVANLYDRQITAPELYATRSEAYVTLEQCQQSNEACATLDLRVASLGNDFGVLAVGDVIILETED